MKIPSDNHPFCYESRDLMRARNSNRNQRRLTVVLALTLALLIGALWLMIHNPQ